MLTAIVISLLVPALASALVAAASALGSTTRANELGVALQTVIIIVVLLAIAGAVAGVLVSRGGEAVAEAERQDIVRAASEFTHEGLCESYGLIWTAGSCFRTLPVRQPASNFTTQAACVGYTYLGNKPYSWDDKGTVATTDDECV